MGNDLIQTDNSSLPSLGNEYNQNAQKIYNIQHADSISTGTINTTIIINSNAEKDCNISSNPGSNRDYYNLFVLGGEDFSLFSSGSFIVPKERALTLYMTQELKAQFDTLNPEAIEQIKTFPSIFSSENDEFGTCSTTQKAYLGIVKDIKIQDNGIKIYYQTIHELPQKRLNELLSELSLYGTTEYNELNKTHWAIKEIDLISVLHASNIKTGLFN